jgi:hypothetical protein
MTIVAKKRPYTVTQHENLPAATQYEQPAPVTVKEGYPYLVPIAVCLQGPTVTVKEGYAYTVLTTVNAQGATMTVIERYPCPVTTTVHAQQPVTTAPVTQVMPTPTVRPEWSNGWFSYLCKK